MHLKYLHYFGNESNESLLEAYGIIAKDQKINPLGYKQCPNCSEPNKPDSKYCINCQLVLSYDAYSETLEIKKEKENDLNFLRQQMQSLISILGSVSQEGKQEIAKQLIEKGIYKKANS